MDKADLRDAFARLGFRADELKSKASNGNEEFEATILQILVEIGHIMTIQNAKIAKLEQMMDLILTPNLPDSLPPKDSVGA